MEPSQVIIRPVVSEKSYVLATADKYTFRVHPDAHKTPIKQPAAEPFGATGPAAPRKPSVLAPADKYTFRVHPDAHKTQIKQAVEQLFGVTVLGVHTSKVP